MKQILESIQARLNKNGTVWIRRHSPEHRAIISVMDGRKHLRNLHWKLEAYGQEIPIRWLADEHQEINEAACTTGHNPGLKD